ncbi:hypothetical protein Q5P01_016384 [Channa striata]|uniref:Uncharacterized protein n=1 Tax=Channa striata TaxID=64152 RepID=A0AA88SFL7_CHASR|nr:hypothetical protein Q5P01_016384 [Channa striata]
MTSIYLSSIPSTQRGGYTQLSSLKWVKHVRKQFSSSSCGQPSAVAELVKPQFTGQNAFPKGTVGRGTRGSAHKVTVNGQDFLGSRASHEPRATGPSVCCSQHTTLKHETQGGGAMRHGKGQRDRLRSSERKGCGNVLEAKNATVRAWLAHLKNGSEPRTYHGSIFGIQKVLQIMPLSERPTKPPTECPSWSAQLMWQITRNTIHQCPFESDIIDMLKFPLASTGECFGVVRRFQPFKDGTLERARLHAVTQPSVTLSGWIYLL